MRTPISFSSPLCRRHWFPNTALFTVPGLCSLSPAPILPPPARSPARYSLSCPCQAGRLTPPNGRSFPPIPALSGTPLPLQSLHFQAVLLRFPDVPHTGRGYRQTSISLSRRVMFPWMSVPSVTWYARFPCRVMTNSLLKVL